MVDRFKSVVDQIEPLIEEQKGSISSERNDPKFNNLMAETERSAN
jgi:hypothetical protein